MSICPDNARAGSTWALVRRCWAALFLAASAMSCRTSSADATADSPAITVTGEHAATNVLQTSESTNEAGRVISVYVNETGDVLWDGEPVNQQTLRERLAALRPEDTIAWYSGAPSATMSIPQQSVWESILKLGLRTVWVQNNEASTQGASEGRPVTVNTKYIREAFRLYDQLQGSGAQERKLLPADVMLRFEPDEQKGYVLRRVEVGLVGQSIWLVHESLSDAESATSIQLKKEW